MSRYQAMTRCRDERALSADLDTSDLVLMRRRRGPGVRDSAEAELWAQTQPWHDRVVKRTHTGIWWVWRLLPEAGSR